MPKISLRCVYALACTSEIIEMCLKYILDEVDCGEKGWQRGVQKVECGKGLLCTVLKHNVKHMHRAIQMTLLSKRLQWVGN